jgi:tetratricopeptide (TPR) repeat protein
MRAGPVVADPRESRRRVRLLVFFCAVVALLVAAVHWPVLSTEALSFDDGQYLTENELVQNPGFESAGRFLTEVLEPSTVRGYYQPLSMISLMLDYAAGGRPDHLFPFHCTSLCLHVVNTVLVVVLLYLLFGQPWPAALVGLLYGIHPLTVEPIPWVAERKTLLGAFFALWCLILYVRYVRRTSRTLYVAVVVVYVLGLMSKPTTVPLPALLLLLDVWPIRRVNKRTLVEKAPLFIIGGIFAVITLVSQRNTANVVMPSEIPPGRIPLMLCHNIVFYLLKTLAPTNMSAWYAFPEPFAISRPMVLAGVVATCVLIPGLLISARWTRAWLVGWLFFFVAIFPTLGIIGFHPIIAADRHAYLPLIGFLLPATWLLGRFWSSASRVGRRRVGQVAAGVVVLSLGVCESVATRRTLAYWRDSETLFRYMLSTAPRVGYLHHSLANRLMKQGRLDEAFEHYAEALRLQPDYFEGHGSLAVVLLNLGRFAEAEPHYRAALRLRPDDAKAREGLAGALAGQGRLEESLEEFAEALRLKPRFPSAHYNLARVLADHGRIAEAIERYENTLRLKPDHYKAHYNLAQLLISQRRMDEGVAHLHEVLRYQPDFPEAHQSLGHVALARGGIEDAITHFRAVIRQRPDSVDVANNLAWLLATHRDAAVRDAAEAVGLAEQACEATGFVEPAYLDTLAAAYAASGRFEDAIEVSVKAIRLAAPKNPGLVGELEQRLRLYRQGRPYRAATGSSP